ncbi:hypothetical protein NK8_59100 (plasmid) [Caballeronia sp. NK8]|uniref:STM2901 family protein n=1 Tax=Caballeronia sp. NK8 TaxID=140098 RepID=UPI001BB6741D|nr:hypothetical protein [Caballeronia sp. NK8]BCQ27721.1 hypothetical protein NK8_59100 [Caballeronia sp. NK8]
MSEDLYRYGDKTLTAHDLYFYVLVEETCERLGVRDVGSVVAILLGQPYLNTRAKPRGATKGTSIASRVSRALLDFELPWKALPTLTNRSILNLRILMTRNLAVFVGRSVPIVGWVILAYDVVVIMNNTEKHFNRLVKPEDQLRGSGVGIYG